MDLDDTIIKAVEESPFPLTSYLLTVRCHRSRITEEKLSEYKIFRRAVTLSLEGKVGMKISTEENRSHRRIIVFYNLKQETTRK